VSHPSAITAGTQLVLTASVTPTSEQYSLHNKTTGKTTTYTGAGLSTVSLQDTTQFGSGTSGGFAPFKDSAYLDLTVNGQGLDGLPISGVSQVDGAGKVLVQATPLASNGEAFALIYKSNVGDAGR
jgi:hypothetical protein